MAITSSIISSVTGGGGSTPVDPPLSAPISILCIGDSQTAGRGCGTGAREMTGARVLSWPTLLRDSLIAAGYPAQSEGVAEAVNSGGATWPNYDSRVALGGWLPQATGTISAPIGGRMGGSSAAGDPFVFTPTSQVDTFEIFTPQDTGFGTLDYSVDGGGTTEIDEDGAEDFIKTTVSLSLGNHAISLNRTSGNAYIAGINAYNSAANNFRILNMGMRGAETADWQEADELWEPFPAILDIAADIALIMLGVNDIRSGGGNVSAAVFETRMQAIITQCVAAGSDVALVTPMPFNPADEGVATQAEMITAYENLATANSVPLFHTETLLGDWTTASGNSEVSDDLHWLSPASAELGAALVPTIEGLAGL